MDKGCSGANYVTQVVDDPAKIAAQAWDDLLLAQDPCCGPFMRHAFLHALHQTGCASPATGWHPRWLTLWQHGQLVAAAPLYLKTHSRGEYVFDWAWAEAHERHGLPYYPKGVVAVPFTPVTGPRLLARDTSARQALLKTAIEQAQQWHLSSVHLLFQTATELSASTQAGWLARQTVQFHWQQRQPRPYASFDDFLSALTQEKRKKIRQERRKVAEAGVQFEWRRGHEIRPGDWLQFYRCYERTYHEHGQAPYLNQAFFQEVAAALPGLWLLCLARRSGQVVACSLVALSDASDRPQVAYGRYWGALDRVDCLHFETCYYQPIEWCIAHSVQRFEGGAQGEHKMARALLPSVTHSAHWLAHPAFAAAVERHLQGEEAGVSQYLADLEKRNPLRGPN